MECQICNFDLSELIDKHRDWKYVGDIITCPNCGKQYEVCGDEGYINGQQYDTFWIEPIN